MLHWIIFNLNLLLRFFAGFFPAENSLRKFTAGLWNKFVGSQEYVGVKINSQTFNLIPYYRSITRDHEPSVWYAIENILSDATCFLDVGANIGIYTLLAAKTLKPTGTISSFEPNLSAFNLLKKHVLFNPGTVAPTLKNAAIYDGTIDFVAIHDNAEKIADPESQISFKENDSLKTTPCISLDSLTLPDQRILIKIDVEGAETGVLRGARTILTSPKEVALILAVHPQQLASFGETIQSLQDEINRNNLLTMDMNGNSVDLLSNKLDEYICTNSARWFESLSRLMSSRSNGSPAPNGTVNQ